MDTMAKKERTGFPGKEERKLLLFFIIIRIILLHDNGIKKITIFLH
jgi:hypothetical protein